MVNCAYRGADYFPRLSRTFCNTSSLFFTLGTFHILSNRIRNIHNFFTIRRELKHIFSVYCYLNLIYIGVLNLILYVYILYIKIDKADCVKTQSAFISSNLIKCLKLKYTRTSHIWTSQKERLGAELLSSFPSEPPNSR